MSADSFLVVIDPTTIEQPALERAIESAKLTGGSLHLFECIHDSYALQAPNGATCKSEAELIDAFTSQLSSFEEKVRAEQIEVSSQLIYQKNWREAVIKATCERQCAMVYKPSYFHTRAERSEDTADWTLLRNCPRPVMLIHNKSRWEDRRVLAAVNLLADDAAHQKLNRNVISIASTLTDTYQADVHFINAIQEADVNTNATVDDDLWSANQFTSSQTKTSPKKIALSTDYIAEQCGVDENHAHIAKGFPTEVILKKACELQVDLIVVGTVARQGIRARILGNTVEELLDDIECDILALNVDSTKL